MKRIIVYSSQTGFTERYAKWIAKALDCESIPLKQASKEALSGYDKVIYGGWVMGNMIFGLDKLLNITPNPEAVFAVGSTPASDDITAAIKEQNKLESTPLFYMQGGFAFEKLAFPQRMILKVLKKSVAKKANKSPHDEFMAKTLGTSFDGSDERQIDSLVNWVSL
ncbi:MAG: flavodoxin domain-containing protein [Eubacteriales bacterium]|nr:flavodoxin domain-containing protein [Eubacteriales bacterium]